MYFERVLNSNTVMWPYREIKCSVYALQAELHRKWFSLFFVGTTIYLLLSTSAQFFEILDLFSCITEFT